MKTKSLLLFVALIINAVLVNAANYKFLPYTAKQPDGAIINCFVSGDEYFNWMHDKDGYTIIQGDDGYYYYGVTQGDNVVPSAWMVGKTDPSQVGLGKWAKISRVNYNQRRALHAENVDGSVKAPHLGTMNNIAVYIRFNDDNEFTVPRQSYDDKFNAPAGYSLKSYFSETSYTTFTIDTYHYPECAMTTNYSYRDPHNRSYFQPYNATTNPDGYNGNEQARIREHTLLKDAIAWINANSPVPPDLNIDGDNDGKVDNVNFIIRGSNGAWADLLWGHMWSLYTYNVNINGKRVYGYTFEPETQADVQTFCHEMFHALGSPDLYHYSFDGLSPAGAWDLMESGGGHMGAYMKWKYTDQAWINSIPEITTSGTYTLHPLTSQGNNCYKIASPNSLSQYFVVEYRRKLGTFEGTLPGSGLLVYRIDTTVNGNADGPPDEVYIYRPGGTVSNNGSPGIAYYSAESGRTAMNENTNPASFLQDGTPGGLIFMDVTSADTVISFTVNVTHISDPDNFNAVPVDTAQIRVTWQNHPDVDHIMLAYDLTGTFGSPDSGADYLPGDTLPGGGIIIYTGTDTLFNHLNLTTNTRYYYKTWSVKAANEYSFGVTADAMTLCRAIGILPFTEGFETGPGFPGCWVEENDNPSWIFCQGNGSGVGSGFPADAHSGSMNACLRDMTTAPNKNKLILPVMDLSSYTNIEVRFWMFMQWWGSRKDELTVFYRISPSDSWISLQTYTQSITSWTEQILPLPVVSSQFQLAFEGNAKFGFGVCIDDIMVDGTIVGIGENASDEIRVFPNPAPGLFRVTGAGGNNAIREINVFDSAGKKLAGISGNRQKEFSFDLSFAAPGIYILKITTEKEVKVRKLILTK